MNIKDFNYQSFSTKKFKCLYLPFLLSIVKNLLKIRNLCNQKACSKTEWMLEHFKKR